MIEPTHEQVLAAVDLVEPATVMEVLRILNLDWAKRGTVRNRLDDLRTSGDVIGDEGWPERFAINQLAVK